MKALSEYIKEQLNEAFVSKSGLKIPAEFNMGSPADDIAAFDTLINQIKIFAAGCEDNAISNKDMNKFYRLLYKDFAQLRGYKPLKSPADLREFMITNAEALDLISYIKFTREELKKTGQDKKAAQAILDKFEKYKISEEEAEEEPDTTIVIRTADGTADVYFYKALPDESKNQIKYAYSKLYGVNYYDARPITFKRWSMLDDKHKYASRRDKE